MKWSKLFCAWKTATSTMLSEEKNATRASTNTLTVNAYTTDHRPKSHSFYQRLLPENSQQNLAYKTCFSISSRLHDWLWTTGSVSTFTLTVTSSSLCIHSLLSIHSNSSRTDRGHLSHSLMTFFPSTLCSVTKLACIALKKHQRLCAVLWKAEVWKRRRRWSTGLQQ